jgi:hypothetical protein
LAARFIVFPRKHRVLVDQRFKIVTKLSAFGIVRVAKVRFGVAITDALQRFGTSEFGAVKCGAMCHCFAQHVRLQSAIVVVV